MKTPITSPFFHPHRVLRPIPSCFERSATSEYVNWRPVAASTCNTVRSDSPLLAPPLLSDISLRNYIGTHTGIVRIWLVRPVEHERVDVDIWDFYVGKGTCDRHFGQLFFARQLQSYVSLSCRRDASKQRCCDVTRGTKKARARYRYQSYAAQMLL